MSIRIFVLGSINYDIVAKSTTLPDVGETVEGFSVDMYVGGKGSNQAVQAAMLGAQTYFIGSTGSDQQGIVVREGLASKGVDIRYLNISPTHRTGCASIIVDFNGDNMLVYAPGANKTITKDIVDSAAQDIATAQVFITQNEINSDMVTYGLEIAKAAGIITILNPAPALPLDENIFKLVDYITPNETESEVYTGLLRKNMDIDNWKRKNAEWFLERGVKNVCITMGEKGSYFYNRKEEISLDAFQITPIDTTAAGDAFNGGFAYGIANKWSIRKCMKFGNACGALAAQTVGAQNSICPLDELTDFLNQQSI
ncbi:ribokinase [Alkalibaculum sp. M08DMB]|uniref:Ribokinase n=1 Tax=Alkalibaculum sporogenes TaxID=2655001 RepID=A0A6A7K7C0_9FIRM|nr:ribokinase [Alkalibaculum sporogenes]MPW25231.1 ribokinase [Alkalibaculum sporogenes]